MFLFIKCIFIVKICVVSCDIDIDVVFYEFDEILDNLTVDNRIVSFFKQRSSTPT